MNERIPQPQDRQLAALYRLMAPLLAAGVLLSGLTLTLFTGHPIGGWMTITVFLIASLLIGHPRPLLMFFFALVVVHPTLQNLHSHWLLQLADKLMAILLMGVVFMHFIKNRDDRRDLSRFNRILFLFLCIAAVSTIVNRVAPIQVIRFFLTYGSFIPAFYAAYYFLRPDTGDARRALIVLFIVFGLQLLLNLGWLAGINPLPNRFAGSEDFAIGTLGICNLVAYLTASLMFLLLALFHNLPELKNKILVAFGTLAALIQLALTFTFHVLPPMAVLLFFQTLYGVRMLRYKLAMLALAGFVVVGFYYIKSNPRLSDKFGFPAEETMTVAMFRGRWDQMWRGNKGQAYYNIFVRARHDLPAWYLGAGPGNFASGIGMVHRSMMAEKYVNYIYLTYTGRLEMVGGSITQHVTTGFSAIYSEFGPPGFLLFFWLHAAAAWHVFRQLRRGAYRSPLRRALAEAFIPTMLLYLGLNLLSDFLSDTFLQVGVWLWAGLVWKPDAEPPFSGGETIVKEPGTMHSLPPPPLPQNASWR